MVTNIEKAFEKSDPARREDFRRNLAAYVGQLNALDADIAAQIGSLTDKKLVTNHDAFGYYVDHFGLQFVGSIIPSFDTSAELSARDISDLVRAHPVRPGPRRCSPSARSPPRRLEPWPGRRGSRSWPELIRSTAIASDRRAPPVTPI